jgi:ribosomal protein S18 acetylase RimI-like enzyme
MRLRAATPEDAQAATDLYIAGDVEEVGEVDYSLGDLLDEWRVLDLAKDTVIVEDDDGTIVGCAHFRGGDLFGQVDSRRTGEGFGTAILDWAHARAKERGATRIRQGVGHNGHAGRALLEANGYAKVRSYWRMVRATSTNEHADETGLRAIDPDDANTLYAIQDAAFARNPDYEFKPRDEWIASAFNAHDVDLEASRTAPDKGFALVRAWNDDTLYVPLLAVHPDHQGQGLGARLLQAVFKHANGRTVTLNVASDNPNAVKLYERVGMRQQWRVDDYQKALPD